MTIQKILSDFEKEFLVDFIFDLENANFLNFELNPNEDLKEKEYYWKYVALISLEKYDAEVYATYKMLANLDPPGLVPLNL